MSVGLGVLRLSPGQFWAMTPRELDAALRGVFGFSGGPQSPTRSGLYDLMRRYPDVDASSSAPSTFR